MSKSADSQVDENLLRLTMLDFKQNIKVEVKSLTDTTCSHFITFYWWLLITTSVVIIQNRPNETIQTQVLDLLYFPKYFNILTQRKVLHRAVLQESVFQCFLVS